MAFEKAYEKKIYSKSIIFENAYHKITRFNGDQTGTMIEINIFDNAKKTHIIDTRTYVFNPSYAENAFNITKQGYAYLKTTVEYQDAIDVLEEGQLPLM